MTELKAVFIEKDDSLFWNLEHVRVYDGINILTYSQAYDKTVDIDEASKLYMDSLNKTIEEKVNQYFSPAPIDWTRVRLSVLCEPIFMEYDHVNEMLCYFNIEVLEQDGYKSILKKPSGEVIRV
jgi:hypothetical protein